MRALLVALVNAACAVAIALFALGLFYGWFVR